MKLIETTTVQISTALAPSVTRMLGVYLVLICALLELFELVVEHGEMASDALYPSMQTPVLTVFGVKIVFIPLPLIGRADHRIFPIEDTERMFEDTKGV